MDRQSETATQGITTVALTHARARTHTHCQQTVIKPVLLIVKTSVRIIIYPPSAARSHNTQNALGLCEISI